MLNKYKRVILFLSPRRARRALKSSALCGRRSGSLCTHRAPWKGLALSDGWACNLAPACLRTHLPTSTEYYQYSKAIILKEMRTVQIGLWDKKSSFLNRRSLLIGIITETFLWSSQVTLLRRITVLMIFPLEEINQILAPGWIKGKCEA